MWSIFNGTIVNALTVAIGSTLGLVAGARLPERYRVLVLQALGLVTLTLGIDAGVLRFADTVREIGPQVANGRTFGARLAMVMIVCLLVGALVGTALRLHERIEGAGAWIHQRFSQGDTHRFAEGFLTASVIFCIGPLTLLGCIRNGIDQDPAYLYIKATLDGFCSLALASSLGLGVLASVLTILVFQGGLTAVAAFGAAPLDPLSISLMTIVGGIMLLGTGLVILDVKKIRVANLLPGLFLPPLAIQIVEFVLPGCLLPASVFPL